MPGITTPRSSECCDGMHLPSTAELLVQGGDARIALDPQQGSNKYGCRPQPDNDLLAFGSSTASVISAAGFAAADSLRDRLLLAAGTESHAAIYARELNRMRQELLGLCGVSSLGGVECVFAASGTDIHFLVAQLVANARSEPALIVMVDAVETGSGVPAALAGRHFSSHSALGTTVAEGALMTAEGAIEIATVPVRCGDGNLRNMAEVDAEVESLVLSAVAAGRRVLLIMADVSKTGLIAPSTACVMALRQRLADVIEVLVDACQFRLAPPTLHAYLDHGFMVALTGSKFVSGPPFCGALLIPSSSARRLRSRPLPRALADYSNRAEWPPGWTPAEALVNAPNFGLLLRWEAALEELREFRAAPEADVAGFLHAFACALQSRLENDPGFEPLPVPQLVRLPLLEAMSWDQVQTIFPFLLYRSNSAGRTALSRLETQEVYRLLKTDLSRPGDHSHQGELLRLRCQLGQPVSCGSRDGVPVSALRLCVSTRLVVEAVQSQEHAALVIDKALAVLDKAGLICAQY